MSRFLAVVFASLGIALIAAGPTDVLGKPSVVVYPFTAATSTINRETTSELATLIATQMAATGRVTVIPAPPGTERKDYLAVARAEHADYYIAGFLSPLAEGVSVVEQVVSTTSGIVINSSTAQLTSYADAAGQGELLALMVSRHANRTLSSIGTPPPAPPPTVAPNSEAETNLGKLFAHKKKPAATPAPSIAVVPVEGPADTALRDAATVRLASRAHADRTATAAAACSGHPHDTILTGSLSLKGDATTGSSASLDLVATDCSGKTLWSRTFTSDATGAQGAQLATERVVDAAVGAYLNPPKPSRS